MEESMESNMLLRSLPWTEMNRWRVVQFSHSVVSDSLRPPWTAARQASLSITNSRSHPNPCPSSRWYHPTISSSVVPFSSCPLSFSASGSFPMSQLFASCGQSTGVSASTSVLPMNTQNWSPLRWTGWISLQSDYNYSSPELGIIFKVSVNHNAGNNQLYVSWTRMGLDRDSEWKA